MLGNTLVGWNVMQFIFHSLFIILCLYQLSLLFYTKGCWGYCKIFGRILGRYHEVSFIYVFTSLIAVLKNVDKIEFSPLSDEVLYFIFILFTRFFPGGSHLLNVFKEMFGNFKTVPCFEKFIVIYLNEFSTLQDKLFSVTVLFLNTIQIFYF